MGFGAMIRAPNIYDLLLPPEEDQVKILGGYDVAKRRPALLPMVGR